MSCKKGTIFRKAYTRHLNNKPIHISSSCIKAQSQLGTKRSTRDSAIIKKRMMIHKTIRKQFGSPNCKKGQVVREGYTRKAYVRKSGSHVKSSKVGPGCIKATGLSRKRGTKGKQLFVLEKGTLTKYGYHANLSETERHTALTKAMKETKPLSVYRKLNAVYVLNKNKNPSLANTYRKDADWLQKTQEYMER